MKTTLRRIMAIIMAVAIVMTAINPVTAQAAGKKAKKVKLNKTKVDLTIGGSTYKPSYPTVTLKVQNTKKTVKWSTSNKKIATVKKTGKYTAKVTAKNPGVAKITAKVGGKKYTCTVTVDMDMIVGERPLGIYLCQCGYYYIPVYETGLGRPAEQTRGFECTIAAWNAHMAEHQKNGESTSYMDTTKGPKPLGFHSCQCGWKMLIYTYGRSDEEWETAYAHIDEHIKNDEGFESTTPSGYKLTLYPTTSYSSVGYESFLDCLYKVTY